MDDIPISKERLMEMPRVLTPDEAGHYLQISEAKVYSLIKDRILKTIPFIKTCRLSRNEIERFLESRYEDYVDDELGEPCVDPAPPAWVKKT